MAEAGILERRALPRGEVIISQGEMGVSAFLIQSGEVVVFTESGGKRVELARMGPGQIIGEMALVVDGPRSATVQALTDCNLIVITRDVLQEKIQKSDPTIRALLPMLMKRIAQSNKALLRQGGDLDDMDRLVRSLYQELHTSLPAAQKKSLEIALEEPMNAFLKAIADFRSHYGLSKC
ncbi:MAG: cyclic nucleotide-binding domain-containing protein [Micavibrio aeruginosavorus]|uniref:Cyclic nucleotide-binding domain-containing protein n=1 Tax=Micavibrio aeruginosavorus TaxID=349221 RepID=A0A7T5R0D3_9BACT|nr:MAG: cyclic nucleotide-binding domain-containing protein [Micavibrio aeruginosavorus]